MKWPEYSIKGVRKWVTRFGFGSRLISLLMLVTSPLWGCGVIFYFGAKDAGGDMITNVCDLFKLTFYKWEDK